MPCENGKLSELLLINEKDNSETIYNSPTLIVTFKKRKKAIIIALETFLNDLEKLR